MANREVFQLVVLQVSGAEVATFELTPCTTVLDVKGLLGSDPDCMQLVQDDRTLCDHEPVSAGQCVVTLRQVPLPVLHVPISSAPECLGESFEVSKSFTMCAFVKVAGAQGGRILAKRAGVGWEFAAPRFNGPVSFYSTASGHHNIGSTRVDDGTEHHVAVTFGKGLLKAYVDGRLDGEMTFSIQAAPGVPLWTRARGGTEDSFIGELRDVMAWHRQLSDEQIAALYEADRA